MLGNTLRLLLIDENVGGTESLSAALARANHSVLPAKGLDEAVEALSVQKFDAVLVHSPLPAVGFKQLTSKLRELEKAQSTTNRIPILSFSPDVADEKGWSPSAGGEIDGYLSERFDPDALIAAVTKLAHAVTTGRHGAECESEPDLPVFEPEKFEAQAGRDPELMAELIDLFASEAAGHIPEMRQALAAGDYDRLYRTAHTIKGSLGSLWATRARTHTQELESAAKQRNETSCAEWLSIIEQDLRVLEAHLAAVRAACATR